MSHSLLVDSVENSLIMLSGDVSDVVLDVYDASPVTSSANSVLTDNNANALFSAPSPDTSVYNVFEMRGSFSGVITDQFDSALGASVEDIGFYDGDVYLISSDSIVWQMAGFSDVVSDFSAAYGGNPLKHGSIGDDGTFYSIDDVGNLSRSSDVLGGVLDQTTSLVPSPLADANGVAWNGEKPIVVGRDTGADAFIYEFEVIDGDLTNVVSRYEQITSISAIPVGNGYLSGGRYLYANSIESFNEIGTVDGSITIYDLIDDLESVGEIGSPNTQNQILANAIESLNEIDSAGLRYVVYASPLESQNEVDTVDGTVRIYVVVEGLTSENEINFVAETFEGATAYAEFTGKSPIALFRSEPSDGLQ